MTRELNIGVGRPATAPAKEELARRLLALVLAAVLVWYTFVIPAGAHARNSAAPAPDDEVRDGEVRDEEVRGRVGGASAGSRVYSAAAADEGFGPVAEEAACESVEDLDWPEYIYPG